MDKMDTKGYILEKVVADHDAIKTLSERECVLLASELREAIIQACSEYGGHLSSNLGAIEATIALHRVFDFPNDKLIFDVGHQCYAHKLLTGRSLEHLGEAGATAGFQKMSESPYDCYEAGHSSTSISAASAFAYARDERRGKEECIAFIGDASIANGLAFEALNDLGQRQSKVIIVLNDNDMSISKPQGSLSRFFRSLSTSRGYISMKRRIRKDEDRSSFKKKFNSGIYRMKNWVKRHLIAENIFDNMGFSYIGPYDGHDIAKIEKALRKAKMTYKPIVVHLRTIKGKGYPYSENDQIGYWHHASPFHIGTGRPKSTHPGLMSWSHYFADLTMKMMESHEKARLLVAATLKGAGLEKVFALKSDKCLDFGIAEEHTLTFAGGLALNGYHPIVSIYSTFLQRAYDQLFHDCARMNVNMTILLDRACLDGKTGDTHQGVYDEAYLKSIPNTVVTMASDKAIGEALYAQSFEGHGVFVIRIPRELVEERHEPPMVNLSFLRYRYEGNSRSKKLAVIAVGPREKELLALAKKNYLDFEIIDPVYLYPLQKDNLIPLMSYQNIIVYDAYGTVEGFASTISSGLGELGYRGNLVLRAIPNEIIPQNEYEKQLGEFGLLPKQILALAKEILEK